VTQYGRRNYEYWQ